MVRRAGCRRPPVSIVRGQMTQCSPNLPRTEVYVFMARRVQKASRVYRPWTDGTEDPQPCHAPRFLFWAYPARDACRWASFLERPTSLATGVPLSTPSTVCGLLPLSVTDSRCGDRTRAPPCRHPPPRISRWYGLTPVDTEYRASAGYCLARPRSLTVSPRASVEGARRVLQRRKSCAAEALSRRGAR